MGLRTDLTSLGAIGLGTAVAVAGTGAILFAVVSEHAEADACVAVSPVPAVAPAAPTATRVVSTSGATIVISERVAVRATCGADRREEVVDVRIRARAEVDAARARSAARSAELRVAVEAFKAEVEALRAEALESGEVSPERIQALVESSLRSN